MASIPNYPTLYNEVLPAGADLSDSQFYFVKKDSGTYIACAGATDIPDGVLQNKPELDEPCEVIMFGPTKVSSNEALTAGWFIGTSADGQADRKIPGTDTTEYVCGRVLSASGAAGQISAAFIDCVTPHRAA